MKFTWIVCSFAIVSALAIGGCGPKEKFCEDRPGFDYHCYERQVQPDADAGNEEEDAGSTVIPWDGGATGNP